MSKNTQPSARNILKTVFRKKLNPRVFPMSSNIFVTKSSVNEIVGLTKFVHILTNPEPQHLPNFNKWHC